MELKTARTIARLTQRELAGRAGVDVATISAIENGKRSIGVVAYESVVRIARALNVDAAVLFPVSDIAEPVAAVDEVVRA